MKNLLLIVMLLGVSVLAQDIPPAIPGTLVQDHANVLSPEDDQINQTAFSQFKVCIFLPNLKLER